MNKKIKKDSIEKELENNHFRVSIFGSARIKREDKDYKKVFTLAKMLGAKEIDIVTGGGPGIMEAANRGHRAGKKNNKSHSIGLAIKLPHEQKSNKSIDIEKEFKRFSKRLDDFMLLSNAVVIAPGGVGTTLEFFYTWQLLQTKQICTIPIIFLGDMWPGLIEWVKKYPLRRKYLEKKDLDNIFFAKNCKEAVAIINEAYNGVKSGKIVCINKKKYGPFIN